MANFGSSLARVAGAGLLQYGQFKYQEQLETMREANLAKREAARMEFEKGQRSEDRAMRGQERKEDRDLRGKERSEDMQLTREQMAAQDAKWRAQFDQQDRQFKETMGYKRVEDLNGAFDAAQKKYEDTIASIGQIELKAGQSPDTPPDFAARVTQAKAIAKAELLNTHASLFDANPEMAKQTRYWGGESYSGWLEAKDAGAKALTDTLLGGTTTPPPAGGSTDTGNSRGDGTEFSRSGAEYTRYDSRDRTAPTSIGLIPTALATQQSGPRIDAPKPPPAAPEPPSLPHFSGTKAELQALINKSSGPQRQTLMQIMQQRF